MVQERCVNPFFHRIELRRDQYLHIILGSIFLAPIRIILSLILFAITSLLARIFITILNNVDVSQNSDKYHFWRETFKNQLNFLFRTILFICGFYTVTIVQKGDPEKEKDAPIYVFAPHTSLFDILAGVAFDAPSSVAKADIIDIPLFGNIFKMSDPVLVNRDSQNSRQDVFKKVAEVIKYSKIVFFPEATCSNHRVLLHFKNGAFKFGYPVIPVAIRFNQFGGPDSLSWTWDGPSTIVSVWLTLARWQTHMEVTKLPVYYPSEEEKANPDLYAANVSKVLVDELGIPCLFYSYDDVQYFKYDFFRSSTCVKFIKLCDKILISKMSQDSSSVTSNGKASSINSKQNSPRTMFSNFLYDFIDEINENLNNRNLNETLDQESLLSLLDTSLMPNMSNSSSVKEFLYCLEKSPSKPQLLHLKMILFLIDLRVKDLWKRFQQCYDLTMKYEKSSTLSLKSLYTILWISLNLEDLENDSEIQNLEIMSFDDLKNMILNYYNFALRENANSICKETVNSGN